MSTASKTILIIGAGFSGAMTAVNLLRHPSSGGLRVVLVNSSGRMARGIAYGTHSTDHILNVPAGNMSALPEDPENFLRFCRWADPAVQPASFVSRQLYGTYLEAMLAAAEHSHGRGTLERHVGEVLDIEIDVSAGKAKAVLDNGRTISADRVVLAFGHFLPTNPAIATPDFFESPRYIRDPWRAGALDAVQAGDAVVLLGSGLTAVDVSLVLQAPGRGAKIVCMSRRGLEPQPHRSARPSPHSRDMASLLIDMGSTAGGLLRGLRRYVEAQSALGDDWRDVLAALRPHTPALWRRLPVSERKRFLRHLQPYWDVLRHRCAPAAFERYAALKAEERVSVLAGRLLACEQRGDDVLVTFRRRGAAAQEQMRTQWVINCTGPDSNLLRVSSPLVRQLLARGFLLVDPLGLGLGVSDDYAVVDACGVSSDLLHYVGPLLRARDWEATAVPELRVHANALAEKLLQSACSAPLDS
jgi:uncharacterized NAD(P)/FAD-binding protein YdhS